MAGTAWQSELRARGYRLTPQRQLVLEAVDALRHATPDEIAAEVRNIANGVNISTVYRTLELLEELGLLRHAHLGHGAPSYHVAWDDDHVHLVCRDCGGIEEVAPVLLTDIVDQLRSERGFVVDVGHFAVFGRCATCAVKLPRDDLPGNDLPGNDLPGNDLPGNDLPGNDLPGNDLPGNDLPVNDLPRNDVPGDTP